MKHAVGPFRLSATLSYADVVRSTGQVEEAVTLYQQVAEAKHPLAARALVALAECALETGHPRRAVRHCESAWERGVQVPRERLFQAWGRGLAALGHHAQAAQCFAGQAPE
jgi:hypothetical protein